jgi:hypothetical protein
MSSVLATIDQPGPSARSVRASPGANDDRTRPRGGAVSTYARASARTRRTPLSRACFRRTCPFRCPWRTRRPRERPDSPQALRRSDRRTPCRRSARATPPTGARSRRRPGVAEPAPMWTCPAGTAAPVRDVGRGIVRGGHAGRRHSERQRPPGQRGDHRSLVGRQVVLHAAVPGRDGDSDQRHVVDDSCPPRPVPVLAEHQTVSVGDRRETQRRACLRVVVAQHAGELRRRQAAPPSAHTERVVPGGDGVIVRPGHPSLPIATSVGAP